MRVHAWIDRLLEPFRRSSRDEALDADIAAHLDLLTDEFVSKGMARDEARLAARRAFGGVDQVKAHYRDQRGVPLVERAGQDLRIGARSLLRDRGFALGAVLVLGLGVGINNMFFTLVYTHTMRGLPIARPDRVLWVSMGDGQGVDRPLSRQHFEELRAALTSFDELVAFSTGPMTLGDEGRAPDRVDGSYVSDGAFRLTGVRLSVGRDFLPGDHQIGATPVALLGESTWAARYARDPAILGREVLVNNSPVTVIGVVPDRSGFPSTAGIWLPLAQYPGFAALGRDVRVFRVIGRLRDGTTERDARAEVVSAVDRLAGNDRDSMKGWHGRAVPVNDRLLAPLAGAWLAFITAGCIIVLISCANVANLMIARASRRAHEMAIRVSLGASGRRLVGQVLAEGFVIAGLGGLAALVVSLVSVRLFSQFVPAGMMPYWFDYGMDGRILAVLVAVSLGTMLVFGLVPALQAARHDACAILKDGGRSATSRRDNGLWTSAFLAVEIALAVVLVAQLALATVLTRSTLPSDAVVRTTDVVTAAMTLPASQYPTEGARAAFLRRVEEHLNDGPAIESAALATVVPADSGEERHVEVEGRTAPEGELRSAWTVDVSSRYFETLGLTIVRGRIFTGDEPQTGVRPALINEPFVRRYFPDGDPIGARLLLRSAGGSADTPLRVTIVGIAPLIDQRMPPVAQQNVPGPAPVVYVPITATAPATALLLARGVPGTGDLSHHLRVAMAELDATMPLYRMRTLKRAIEDADWAGRVSEGLALTLTSLCLLLAAMGLYAVTAYRVSLRTEELGIRRALGARAGHLIRLVLASVRNPLVAGCLLGLAGALGWDRTFSPGRPDAGVTDPLTLALTMGMIVLVAAVACATPVRRALRVDPAATLRRG